MSFRYETTGEVWRWPGGASTKGEAGGWRFLVLPAELTQGLKTLRGPTSGGFGAIRVEATIGATRWRTSLFPDKTRGCFLLPLKAAVRQAEALHDGAVTAVAIEVLI